MHLVHPSLDAKISYSELLLRHASSYTQRHIGAPLTRAASSGGMLLPGLQLVPLGRSHSGVGAASKRQTSATDISSSSSPPVGGGGRSESSSSCRTRGSQWPPMLLSQPSLGAVAIGTVRWATFDLGKLLRSIEAQQEPILRAKLRRASSSSSNVREPSTSCSEADIAVDMVAKSPSGAAKMATCHEGDVERAEESLPPLRGAVAHGRSC